MKSFEKKDQKLVGTAATNLAFLYLLEGDYKNAEKYSEIAVNTDKYNAKALTNRGNCFFYKGKIKFNKDKLLIHIFLYIGNYEKAKEHYLEAVSVDALCVEAMYNLALVFKRSSSWDDALQWFEKVHSILQSSGEVIFQLADM